MSKSLYQDKNGKVCNAKICWNICFAVTMVKIIIGGMSYGDFSIAPVDYVGMASVLTVVGGVYWGRNHSKEVKKDA